MATAHSRKLRCFMLGLCLLTLFGCAGEEDEPKARKLDIPKRTISLEELAVTYEVREEPIFHSPSVAGTIAILTLRNGKTFEGRIVSETDEVITLEREGTSAKASYIVRIRKSEVSDIARRPITIKEQIALSRTRAHLYQRPQVPYTAQRKQVPTPSVTFAEFTQLQHGMTYEEVTAIIGAQGTLDSSMRIGEIFAKMYSWENDDYSSMSAVFHNNSMVVKTQFGL